MYRLIDTVFSVIWTVYVGAAIYLCNEQRKSNKLAHKKREARVIKEETPCSNQQ